MGPEGSAYTIKSAQSVWTHGNWTGAFWHQGKLNMKRQAKIIILGNPETVIPVTLTQAETFESYKDMGETAVVQDVAITSIAHRVDERARISLVSRHPDAFRISDYGIHGVHPDKKISVVDETGKTYEFERYMGISSPAREFYFQLAESGAKNYTVTIPEINVIYKDKANLTLDIPREVEAKANLTFELAGTPVTITKLERADNNRLRVYVDLSYNDQAPTSLHNFRIDRMSHSAKLNEQTRAMEYLEFEIEPNSKKVKLTLTDPEVIIRGPWKFELPTDQYF